jgi:hypothetical protein
MICPTCKNPVEENHSICEWCNSSLIDTFSKEKSKILYKGECLFYSKRIKKTHCFFEIYDDEIRFFNYDNNVNIRLTKGTIFNIVIYKRLKWMHFIPIIGSIIRFFILLFSRYREGINLITSKSGENIIYLKNQNNEKFKSIITNYM